MLCFFQLEQVGFGCPCVFLYRLTAGVGVFSPRGQKRPVEAARRGEHQIDFAARDTNNSRHVSAVFNQTFVDSVLVSERAKRGEKLTWRFPAGVFPPSCSAISAQPPRSGSRSSSGGPVCSRLRSDGSVGADLFKEPSGTGLRRRRQTQTAPEAPPLKNLRRCSERSSDRLLRKSWRRSSSAPALHQQTRSTLNIFHRAMRFFF